MSKKQPSELDTKLKTLNPQLKSTDVVIGKREKEAVERQRASIVALAGEINCLRASIQEAKFAAGESEENVESWSEGMESDLSIADESVAKLSKCLNEIETEVRDLERNQSHANVMELEKQLLEQKMEAAIKQKELTKKSSVVKLPKLTITSFNGTPIDWVRFESQFTAMVYTQNVHLKELVDPRIRSVIDGLPFNEEGFSCAMKYLHDKYGNPDEIAGPYVINLLEMPAVTE